MSSVLEFPPVWQNKAYLYSSILCLVKKNLLSFSQNNLFVFPLLCKVYNIFHIFYHNDYGFTLYNTEHI